MKPKHVPQQTVAGHNVLADPLQMPLFNHPIEDVKGILNAEVRKHVKKVSLVFQIPGLSFHILYCGILAQVIPKNFPNADFVDYTGLMQLVKRPEDSTLTLPENRLNKEPRFDTPTTPESSVSFWMQGYKIQDAENLRRNSALTVCLPEFGHTEDYAYAVITPKQAVEFEPGEREWKTQPIRDRQVQLLSNLGLEGLPKHGERLILTPDEYSIELRQAIQHLSRVIKTQAGGKPVILVNNIKRMPNEFGEHQNALTRELQDLVKNVDAAVLVNHMAPRQWSGLNPEEDDKLKAQAEHLERTLRETPKRKATILDMKPLSLVELAAVMRIAHQSRGFLLDVFSGTTLLADWLDARELVIGLANWSELNQDRPNKRQLTEWEFPGKLTSTAKEMLEAR